MHADVHACIHLQRQLEGLAKELAKEKSKEAELERRLREEQRKEAAPDKGANGFQDLLLEPNYQKGVPMEPMPGKVKLHFYHFVRKLHQGLP